MSDALIAQAAGLPVDWDELFDGAATFVQTVVPQAGKSVGDDVKLKLYGLYKQATEGDVNSPGPGMLSLDFKAKAKWSAWNALKGMGTQSAMQTYVMLVEETFPDWQDGSKSDQRQGGACIPSVSTLSGAPDPNDAAETLHHFAGQGNLQRVKQMLGGSQGVNSRDEEGCTPLHWACDRGAEDVVCWLLDAQADVNAQDTSGMTPLHYAAMSEHEEVCKLLLKAGADSAIVDHDGSTAKDVGPAEWTFWGEGA